MAAGVFTPYSTVQPLFGTGAPWVDPLEAERIASYQTYEEMYWNVADTFKLVSRGPDSQPIYVPNPRTIVDTIHRYVGTGMKFAVTPDVGTPADIELAQQTFTNLFRRERFYSRYNMNRRYGLIRGDWLWHIIADPLKPAGTRISIRAIDPGSWFPIYADDDLDHLVRIHIAEQFVDSAGKTKIKRLTYERQDNGTITSVEGIFDPKEWWLSTRPEVITKPLTVLPAAITAFPVYHIPNGEEPQNPYGSSELRGFERVQTAVNQSISDEELALALEGLGLYATESGGPVDDEGNDAPWVLGPGRVIENVKGFQRVDGVGSVTPYQDHIKFLIDSMYEAAAAGDVARGKVDVQVAESGVALALQLGPTLAKAEEKDRTIADVHTQMFYDLKFWLQAYEGINVVDVEVLPIFGEKVPQNKKAIVDMVIAMCTSDPPLMSVKTGQERLAEVGIAFAPDEFQRILQEAQAKADTAAASDPLASRFSQELNTLGGSSGSGSA